MDRSLATSRESDQGDVDKPGSIDHATAQVEDSDRGEDFTLDTGLSGNPSARGTERCATASSTSEGSVTREVCSSNSELSKTDDPCSQPGSTETGAHKLDHEIREIDAVLKALDVGNLDISSVLSQTTQHIGVPPLQAAAETTAAATHSTGLRLIGQLGSGDSGSSSDSDDSSSDSSESSVGITRDLVPSDEEPVCVRNGGQPIANIPMSKGEVDYRTLPPQECDVPFPEGGTVMPMGRVSHLAEKLVIIESLPGTPPFDEGTVIWNMEKRSIARIFETFGPVKCPRYSVLVNSTEHASALGLTPGHLVYVIPSNMELTKYIFTKQLMKKKGSDASWKDDNEVPPQFQDYSDDESEQAASNSKKQVGRRARQLRTSRTPLTSTHDMDTSLQNSTPYCPQTHSNSSHPSGHYSCPSHSDVSASNYHIGQTAHWRGGQSYN